MMYSSTQLVFSYETWDCITTVPIDHNHNSVRMQDSKCVSNKIATYTGIWILLKLWLNSVIMVCVWQSLFLLSIT